jgi:acetyltransferase
LSGPLDQDIVETLHAANVPFLLGIPNGMKALKYLPQRTEYRVRAAAARLFDPAAMKAKPKPTADHGFLSMRRALTGSGVAVVEAGLASSEHEAIALFCQFGHPVALKAEIDGLLHKSDIGCVRLNCNSDKAVADAYRAVLSNAKSAGYSDARDVLIQPMNRGIAEVYAGIINDPVFGPALTFGLGGIFVEIFKDTATELAPLAQADAIDMIHRIKGAPLLMGARGRARGDVDALATFLVRLGEFAVANFGQFRSLDLNPIMIGAEGEGVVAVDIAVEPLPASAHKDHVKEGATSPA